MTLPAPDAAFRWTIEPWGAALRCDALSALAQHVFTARQPGSRVTADPEGIEWAAVACSAGAAAGRLVRVRQVHGNAVRVVRRGITAAASVAERHEADAIVSDEPGLPLAVQVADCVPLLMADAGTGAVAAVHAGWRGACARVAAAALAAMAREFGTKPEDVTAAVGPAIRPCCYEVGAELLLKFEADHHAEADVGRWFTRVPGASSAGESLRLDVPHAIRDQLGSAGVRADRIFDCGLCTKCHHGVFESFRAAGRSAGRMAAVIAVPANRPINR